MISKTREKIMDKFEKFQKNIEHDLKDVLEKTVQHENKKRNSEFQTLKNDLGSKLEMFDSNIQSTKQDIGKQMHEMCTMVEEIANMSKGVEMQFKQKEADLNQTH